MGGKVGALSSFFKAVASKWGPEVVGTQARVGEFLQSLAKDPQYFATSKVIPAGDDVQIARALERKHGMEPGALRPEEGTLTHRPSGASIYTAGETPEDLQRQLNSMTQRAMAERDPDMIRIYKSNIQELQQQLSWAQSGGMRPNGEFNHIDMTGAIEGTGTAKNVYPVFNDWLMAHPGSGDATTVLTDANRQKKGIYTAGALEKYGDAFRNRVRVIPEQLDNSYGVYDNTGRFQKMDTRGQIGALNSTFASHSNDKLSNLLQLGDEEFNSLKMDQAMGDIKPSDSYRLQKLGEAMEQARRLRLDPGSHISLSDNLPAINDVVGQISGHLNNVSRPLGLDSLRRTAITNDVVRDPQLNPEDLIGSDTIRHLAKAKGGRVEVPHKSFGPLTRCHCGAK